MESPGIKPDCNGVRISLSWKWLYKCLNTILSKVLSMLLRWEIGLLLERDETSPPLETGHTCDLFQMSGTSDCCRDWLKRVVNSGESSVANAYSTRLLITSGPDALPSGKDKSAAFTSASVITKLLKIVPIYTGIFGRVAFCLSKRVWSQT